MLHADMLFALMQNLFTVGISRQFAIISYISANTALQDPVQMDLFAGLWRLVRSLHRLTGYNFELSIPYASCSKATCISAAPVQGLV